MSNLTCEDLLVNGRIIFSDNSTQTTSANPLFSKCAQIERNSVINSTSILNDNLIVNNSLHVGNQLTSNFINTNGIAFPSDLDENGVPFVQNAAFTSDLKRKLEDLDENAGGTDLSSIVPDIIEPSNKKVKVKNLEVQDSTNTNNCSLTINETTGDLEITANTGSVNVNERLNVSGPLHVSNNAHCHSLQIQNNDNSKNADISIDNDGNLNIVANHGTVNLSDSVIVNSNMLFNSTTPGNRALQASYYNFSNGNVGVTTVQSTGRIFSLGSTTFLDLFNIDSNLDNSSFQINLKRSGLQVTYINIGSNNLITMKATLNMDTTGTFMSQSSIISDNTNPNVFKATEIRMNIPTGSLISGLEIFDVNGGTETGRGLRFLPKAQAGNYIPNIVQQYDSLIVSRYRPTSTSQGLVIGLTDAGNTSMRFSSATSGTGQIALSAGDNSNGMTLTGSQINFSTGNKTSAMVLSDVTTTVGSDTFIDQTLTINSRIPKISLVRDVVNDGTPALSDGILSISEEGTYCKFLKTCQPDTVASMQFAIENASAAEITSLILTASRVAPQVPLDMTTVTGTLSSIHTGYQQIATATSGTLQTSSSSSTLTNLVSSISIDQPGVYSIDIAVELSSTGTATISDLVFGASFASASFSSLPTALIPSRYRNTNAFSLNSSIHFSTTCRFRKTSITAETIYVIGYTTFSSADIVRNVTQVVTKLM
jgi:hypothetical protein